jgi:hypothetical protein
MGAKMARWYKKISFTGAAENVAVALPVEGGGAGKFSVYAQESGGGTSTLGVSGAFESTGASVANDRVQITAPASTGSGALTQITAATDASFPYLILIFAPTGESDIDVFVSYF